MSLSNLSFVSMAFPIFVAALFLVYYIVPKKIQWVVLLVASVAFYASYGKKKAIFIIAASLIAWIGGLWIQRIYEGQSAYSEDKKVAAQIARRKARFTLTLCVVSLLGILLYCKIGKWAIESLHVLVTGQRIEANVWVALGVSYFSFSLIGYLADIYWRKDAAERNYFHLLLFTIYFPKVVQGPISRHKNLGSQLSTPHPFDYREFTFGVQRICWGYFKKMVIADRLAILVNKVYGMHSPAGAYVLVATVFAAFQLYCDFSGCMDIVIGISQSLGLTLEENFNHPFFSRTASEFWRRWHITLGTWFKDYVYMPLVISPRLLKLAQGVRKHFGLRASKALMTLIPTFIVWILTGLWHATGWNYVAWGLMWGTAIGLSTVFDPQIKKVTKLLRINTQAGSWKTFQMVRTFALFCLGRLLTAPNSLSATFRFLRNMFTSFQPWLLTNGSLYKLGLDRPNFLLAVACLLLLGFVSAREEGGAKLREEISSSNIAFRWLIYCALVLSIMVFGIYGSGYDAASFVYMNF